MRRLTQHGIARLVQCGIIFLRWGMFTVSHLAAHILKVCSNQHVHWQANFHEGKSKKETVIFALTRHLLGFMYSGTPKELEIKSWEGSLQRFTHIPTQLLASKNLHFFILTQLLCVTPFTSVSMACNTRRCHD